MLLGKRIIEDNYAEKKRRGMEPFSLCNCKT
jgi:hypothetical protein